MDDASSSSSSSSSSSILGDDHQVKGLAFEVLRKHLAQTVGHERWDATISSLPRHTREILDAPDINEWYAESEMRRVIHAIHANLAHGDDEQFLQLMRGVAAAGVNRFFRMILGLASGRFVLRNIPTFWKRLRRGPASVRTEQLDDGRVLIHYEDFRYCRDPIYRLLSIANCQAAAFAATKKLPVASVERHGGTSMTLSFEVDE